MFQALGYSDYTAPYDKTNGFSTGLAIVNTDPF